VFVESQISAITNRIEEADEDLNRLHAFSEELSRNQVGFSNGLALSRSELDNAKRVLDALKKGSEQAEAKLTELDTLTTSIGMIPDGRLLLGANITGRAWILERAITNLAALYEAKKFSEAYQEAKNCARRYEQSVEATRGIQTHTGDVYINNDGLAEIYSLGAICAQHVGDNTSALSWARKAVEIKPSAGTKALLVTALKNMKFSLFDIEAESLIQTTLNQTNDEAKQFRDELISSGILKKEP
jgi:tetratricopeptide (TPR) repeat protein